jgi:hypothetical protein
MCLADDIGIQIYYQDTDSMHMNESDIATLSDAFEKKYGRCLIGSDMQQFHSDFSPIKDGLECWSKRLITLGKKCYLDVLEDKMGNHGYHIRMKGIPQPVIENYCHNEAINLEQLYLRLYDGEEITFNLLDGSLGFRKSKVYEQYTPKEFTRRICFRD